MMAAGFAWLLGVSTVLYQMNGTMNRVERAQADAPARIVAGLLKRTPRTRDEMADSLNAASRILQTAKFGKVKPAPSVLRDLSSEIQNAQQQYPDLPSVWQATGQFINYKSAALIPQSAEHTLASARGLDCSNGGIRTYQGRVVVERCSLDLEGTIKADSALFINCIVRYRGGLIPLKRMEFINCIFQFEITSIPPRDAGRAMMQLTASQDRDIRVTVS